MSIFEYTNNYLLVPFSVFMVLFFTLGRAKASNLLDSIAGWLNSRGLFRPKSMLADQTVIDGARILLGLVLLYRLYYIALFVIPLGPSDIELVALILYALLCISLTLGFLAPLSALIMLLFQLHFNFTLQTYTLGNDVVAMMLLCFVLYPVGQLFSVDALLVKKHRWIVRVYAFFTHSNKRTQIILAKAISFYSYCLLCLYSVLLHLNEPLWLNGEAAIHLLSSSYLSRYSDLFQQLFSSSPTAVLLAKASMVGMVAWYLILGPAVLLGGLFRKLVIAWAIAFFLVSAFVLQLSVLPYIEFIILFIWFWNLYPSRDKYSLNMLYDDRCNLCDRTVRSLRILDLYQVIKYRPVSQNLDLAEKVGVSSSELYKNLYCWDQESNRVYTGYDFYLHLCRSILLLIPLYPVLLLFKIMLIGPLVYKLVAKYRIQWFGVCKLPTDTSAQIHSSIANAVTTLTSDTNNPRRGFFRSFLITSSIFSIVFIAIMPGSPSKAAISKQWPELVKSAHILSWTRINVFNREDLGMSQHFFTVEALNKESVVLLPFTATNGSRMSWHKSDRAYFGNSLRWRRWKNVRDILPPLKNDRKKFCEIMMWANARDIKPEISFQFTFYQADWPHPENGIFNFPPANVIGTEHFKLESCTS